MKFQALESRLRQMTGGLTDANRTLLARIAAELVEWYSTIFEALEWPLPLRHAVDLYRRLDPPPPPMPRRAGRRSPPWTRRHPDLCDHCGWRARRHRRHHLALPDANPAEGSLGSRPLLHARGGDCPSARLRELGDAAAELRRDLHPLAAKGLGVDPERPLTREEIGALLAGRRADGKKIAGKHYSTLREYTDPKTGVKKESIPLGAVDFTLTPDKSVSVAWAFAAPAEQAAIWQAHGDAAHEAISISSITSRGPRKGKGRQAGWDAGAHRLDRLRPLYRPPDADDGGGEGRAQGHRGFPCRCRAIPTCTRTSSCPTPCSARTAGSARST